ncbi:MAG: peptidoglycan-associated lipoprotein [Desulfobacterales bacterium C00003106]|jgi:peptidoglycan-associated lipoprotein|nr:peptidoglycan-associated lipoprotein Pal [Deltaproteobacteria bacterium]OEU54849.1 MAG: peptidoglycan-associated lipoprotein [Desulfobacterales bacterium C00003106]OEU60161.1 MAG: peptidoglycan-associated lipoprotein [Desulfobacterales bacterium C00003104]
MAKRTGKYFVLFLAIASFLFLLSCAGKDAKPELTVVEEEIVIEEEPVVIEDMEALEEEESLLERRLREEEFAAAAREAELRDRFINEDIHFEFDKSTLLVDAMEILKQKAEWLSTHEDVNITIEGNCDERGTSEYNLALGERRAESAKAFLIDLGISGNRISTVSYGEERPLDLGHDEAAWSANRRDHFAID